MEKTAVVSASALGSRPAVPLEYVIWESGHIQPVRRNLGCVFLIPLYPYLLRGPHCIQVIPVQGRVTSLSLSHDQLHLLSCSRDNTLKVIDLRLSNIRQVFRYRPGPVGPLLSEVLGGTPL